MFIIFFLQNNPITLELEFIILRRKMKMTPGHYFTGAIILLYTGFVICLEIGGLLNKELKR